MLVLNARIFSNPNTPAGTGGGGGGGAGLPPGLFWDDWREYAAGNWELNAAPPWTGTDGGGVGSPGFLIDAAGHVVNCTANNAGSGQHGVWRTPAALATGKPFQASASIAFQNGSTLFAGQEFFMRIGALNGAQGYQLHVLNQAASAQWQLTLYDDAGALKGTANIAAPAFGTFYTLKLERDASGNVNGYWGGQLLLSTPFAGVSGKGFAMSATTCGPAAGVVTGLQIGRVEYRGFTA